MNVKQTISELKKYGWKKVEHMRFARREHNYVLVNAENSKHIYLMCVGKLIVSMTEHNI